MATIVSLITAVAAIVGGTAYIIKLIAWAIIKTPEQKKEDIDQRVDQSFDQMAKTGRPGGDL